MDYLPLFLDVRDRPCLVVGGGDVAMRKTETLLRSRARVTVVAPHLCADLSALCEQGRIDHRAGPFEPDPGVRFDVMIAATDDPVVNRQVAAHAKQQGVPVNVVDCPQLCTFILPAIIDRDPVVVAVSSAGASPVLARRIRSRIEASLPAATGRFARMLEDLRSAVKSRFATLDARRRFWETAIDGPVAERFYAGDEEGARSTLKDLLDDARAGSAMAGEVYVIGAGSGDPDLLTLKAARLMQRAEVVIYDRGVATEILDRVRKDADRVCVEGDDAGPDDGWVGISRALLQHASSGKRVLRLKAGDLPQSLEDTAEVALLADAGIALQVVRGVVARCTNADPAREPSGDRPRPV